MPTRGFPLELPRARAAGSGRPGKTPGESAAVKSPSSPSRGITRFRDIFRPIPVKRAETRPFDRPGPPEKRAGGGAPHGPRKLNPRANRGFAERASGGCRPSEPANREVFPIGVFARNVTGSQAGARSVRPPDASQAFARRAKRAHAAHAAGHALGETRKDHVMTGKERGDEAKEALGETQRARKRPPSPRFPSPRTGAALTRGGRTECAPTGESIGDSK